MALDDMFDYSDFIGSEQDGSRTLDEDRLYDPDSITNPIDEEVFEDGE